MKVGLPQMSSEARTSVAGWPVFGRGFESSFCATVVTLVRAMARVKMAGIRFSMGIAAFLYPRPELATIWAESIRESATAREGARYSARERGQGARLNLEAPKAGSKKRRYDQPGV